MDRDSGSITPAHAQPQAQTPSQPAATNGSHHDLAAPSTSGLRLFDLLRSEDVSGSSGTGVIAAGAFCPWGRPYTVQLWWRPGNVGAQSAVQYATMADLRAIHSHTDASGNPRTVVRWHAPGPSEGERLAAALDALPEYPEFGLVRLLVMATRAYLAVFPEPGVAAALERALQRLQPLEEP